MSRVAPGIGLVDFADTPALIAIFEPEPDEAFGFDGDFEDFDADCLGVGADLFALFTDFVADCFAASFFTAGFFAASFFTAGFFAASFFTAGFFAAAFAADLAAGFAPPADFTANFFAAGFFAANFFAGFALVEACEVAFEEAFAGERLAGFDAGRLVCFAFAMMVWLREGTATSDRYFKIDESKHAIAGKNP
ncbi:MAG TPA: hypothetical protein VGM92_03840 [Candidatus Kapabacteria bacterium]